MSDLDDLIASVAGWCDPEKAAYLRDLVVSSKARSIVDVGVFGGKSTFSFIEGCRQQGFGLVYGVDSWDLSDNTEDLTQAQDVEFWETIDLRSHMERFLEKAFETEAWDYLRLLNIQSQRAYRIFDDAEIDVLHVDGSHTETAALRDIQNWWPKLNVGGFVILDDNHLASVKPTVEFVKARSVLEKDLNFRESCSVCYKKTK